MAGSMSELEVIGEAQQQLQAIQSCADVLLTRLAAPGSRPLHEAAGIITEASTLVESCTSLLEPRLAGLEAVGAQATAGTVEALWRQRQAGASGRELPAAAPAQALDALLATMNALPGISVTALAGRSPAAELACATALRMLCGQGMVAVVQLAQPGCLVPIRVAVFAPGEDLEGLHTWPWGKSCHLVYRRVHEFAAAALQHFAAAAHPAEGGISKPQQPMALEMLLLWLATYSDLFSRPSSATGALLAADTQDGTLLPPVLRPYQLTWQQLQVAAADPAARTAYHSLVEKEAAGG